MNDGILTMLRAGTSQAHATLEQYVEMPWRAADPARYEALLECFYGWYAPMERGLAALDGWSATGYEPTRRSKLPWLDHDLRTLGRTPEQIAALPPCDTVPNMASLARGFGCAYVMEGATLGGRSITGMIAAIIPPEARTFFQAYGSATRERWLAFIEALERFAAIAPDRQLIVAAAVESFASLESFLRASDARHHFHRS